MKAWVKKPHDETEEDYDTENLHFYVIFAEKRASAPIQACRCMWAIKYEPFHPSHIPETPSIEIPVNDFTYWEEQTMTKSNALS